jgi:hypothetical protein
MEAQTEASTALPAPAPPESATCPACGAPEMLEFCARCGERHLDEEAHSLRRFAAETLDALTSLDSRVGRTLRALVAHPGRLSADHFAGVRRPYLGPLQLFLLCNLAFFLLQAVAPLAIFNLPLQNVLQHLGGALKAYPAPDGGSFGEFMQNREAFEPYAAEFRRVAGTQARSMVIVMVPIFALITLCLWRGRRRYYAQHLVFALHVYAFVMLAWSAIAAAMHLLFRLAVFAAPHLAPALDRSAEPILLLAFSTVFGTYTGIAGWRAFGGPRWAAALRAGVLLLGWFTVLLIYRVVLFFATVAVL